MKIQIESKGNFKSIIFIIIMLIGVSFLIPNYKGSLEGKLFLIVIIAIYYFSKELSWQLTSLQRKNDTFKIEIGCFYNYKTKQIVVPIEAITYRSNVVNSGKFSVSRTVFYFKINDDIFKLDPLNGWKLEEITAFIEQNRIMVSDFDI